MRYKIKPRTESRLERAVRDTVKRPPIKTGKGQRRFEIHRAGESQRDHRLLLGFLRRCKADPGVRYAKLKFNAGKMKIRIKEESLHQKREIPLDVVVLFVEDMREKELLSPRWGS